MTTLHNIQAAFIHDVYTGERTSTVYLDNTKDSAERLSIYSNNTLLSLTDILANAYPVVQKIVGAEFFKTIVRHYIKTHPQPTGNRHTFGEQLCAFLENFKPVAQLSYLPEVAALEWAHFQAGIADNAEAIDFNALIINISSNPAFVLSPHPSVHILRQTVNALEVWQAHQKEEVDALKLILQTQTLMIWRAPDHTVFIRRISDTLASLVTQSQNGIAFGEALLIAEEFGLDMQKFQQEFAEMLNLGVFSKNQKGTPL